MTRAIYPGADIRPLHHGWTLLVTEAGAHAEPSGIHRPAARIPAPVPGTVAGALADAGLFDRHDPHPLHDKDAWYFRSLDGETPGPAILRFEGLATIAEIYVNGILQATNDSMFEGLDVPLELTGHDDVAICFRALRPHLEKRGPRARWRPQLFDHQGLRLIRTTALGHMPGWCPEIHAVGPYRPILLIRPGKDRVTDLAIEADLDEFGTGKLAVRLRLDGAHSSAILCCGRSAELTPDANGLLKARLDLPGVIPWWPRTHGRPNLHDLTLSLDGRVHSLGLIGFRRIEVDHDDDGRGFGLRINGVPVFCRGAVWTNADIVRLSGSAEDYAPWLTMAAEANMNMIRIGGTMTYESEEFFRLCDKLGILVWQDLMLANFDYPFAEEAFGMKVESEVRELLTRLQGHPSLAVICGGSEVFQQGAMLGLPKPAWNGAFFQETLARLAKEGRPDCAYVANSPSGGAMPFSPDEGVTHYYGVGAYQRPLEDARRANVRFAAECLAFAHVPQQHTLDRYLPAAPVHDPRWKARVPRDRGASWDFEDVRDHYLQALYDVDPARLRRQEPDRYLDFSRAVTTEVVTETYAEWRRTGSSCRGALVWTFQDLEPGPGWGVIDATGEAKPVWFGLKRAFRPLQVVLTDEGTNGLAIHVANEAASAQTAHLEVACLRDGRHVVVKGNRDLALDARQTVKLAATDLFGAFFDSTYAFRFGPPSHDVTVARLVSADGVQVAEAFHFPLGRTKALHPAGFEHSLTAMDGGWQLELAATQFAQSVHLEFEHHVPDDDWFHLAPGHTRIIRLIPRPNAPLSAKPTGTVRHLGSRTGHTIS